MEHEEQSKSPSGSAANAAKAPLAHALRSLQLGLAENLDRADLESSADTELLAAVIGVERLAWQLDSLKVLLAALVHDRSTHRAASETISRKHGCASAPELLQRATLSTRAEANRRIRLGRQATKGFSLSGAALEAEHPYLALGLEAAALPIDTARRISAMLSRVPRAHKEKRDFAERSLVEAATGIDFQTGTLADIETRLDAMPPPPILDGHAEAGLIDPLESSAQQGSRPGLAQHGDAITTMTKTWHQYLDQDGTLPTDREILESRRLHLGTERDGVVPISGNLLPEVASGLSNLLDAINAPRNQNQDPQTSADPQENVSADQEGGQKDSPEGRAAEDRFEELTETFRAFSGDPVDLEGRTPAQKRHDAFAAILGVAASSAEIPDHGGSPVTVLVQTTQEALEQDGASWLHGPGSQMTLLTPQALRHASCSGALQHYAKNRRGKLVALGNRQRVFTTNQRRAIVARDGGCVIPGCSTPPAWLEVHHVEPHARGGATHTDNGVAMCWFHHRNLESGGWEVRMNKGVPQVRTPLWLDANRDWITVKPPTQPPTYDALNRWRSHSRKEGDSEKSGENPNGTAVPKTRGDGPAETD